MRCGPDWWRWSGFSVRGWQDALPGPPTVSRCVMPSGGTFSLGPLVGRRDLTSREIKIQGSFSKKKKGVETKRRRSLFFLPSFFFFYNISRNQFQDIGSTVKSKEMHILPRSACNLVKMVGTTDKVPLLAGLACTANRKLDPFILYYYFADAI